MRKGVLVGGAVVGAAALIYLEGSLFFVGRFPFHTKLNGQSVSLERADKVADRVQKETSDYTLTIKGRNGVTDSICASDIAMSSDPDQAVDSAVKSRSIFSWPLSLFSTKNYTVNKEVHYDEKALANKVQTLSFFDKENVVEPTDASVTRKDGKYEVVAETAGSKLDSNKTLAAIQNAVENELPTVDLDSEGCYENASVTSTDTELTADADLLNQYANMEIHIPIGGGNGEDITADQIAEWITQDGDKVKIDTEKIGDYVAELAKKYNTFGTTRSFTTQAGSTITIEPGSYGWWLDQGSTRDAIAAALQSGKGGEVEPVFYQTAVQWPTDANGNSDIGNSYAEVDLDDQHVWIVKDGQVVVSTDCVSGRANNGHGTPDGAYRIAFKQRDATLKGEGYSSPVKYWMPFNMGIGFHDASWRSSFGGTIYLTAGSHGCINLPSDQAAKVYANVDAGMPVIVYGGKNGAAAAQAAASAASSEDADSSDSAASDSSESSDDNSAAGEENQAQQDQTDAAQDQVMAAAKAAADSTFQQQIAAGATQDAALAAAQAAANAVVAGASGAN